MILKFNLNQFVLSFYLYNL